MTRIPTFADTHGNTVVFRKVRDVPGFTHRVFVNNTATDWLAQGLNPTTKTATYFLRKAQGDTL